MEEPGASLEESKLCAFRMNAYMKTIVSTWFDNVAPVQNMPVGDDDSSEDSEEEIGAKMRKIFANRMKLSNAERKRLEKERKARQLHRLGKLLTPKNAIVTLRELLGPGMNEFIISSNDQEATAKTVVNNVLYEATAPNKQLAKARVSEKALRDLVIIQMTKACQAAENKAPSNNFSIATNDDFEMSDESESNDALMLHLASFALYKLFSEWGIQGLKVPATNSAKTLMKPSESNAHPLASNTPKTKVDVPSNATTCHPVGLLKYLRPKSSYEDPVYDPAKREFSIGVTVDEQRFVGKARSKKLARKEAAAAACRQLFDLQFIERLPSNAPTRHPCDLLRYMRSKISYEDAGYNPTKQEFAIGVIVDGQRFIGKARSRKLARKEAAAAACRQLFDLQFIERLPSNAPTRHPCDLLRYMRSKISYEDAGYNPTKQEFAIGVIVDGQRFIGKARSRKLARKEAATAACRQLFSVQFADTSNAK